MGWMKRYTASVVGCGSGGRLSLDALAASDRYELIAACDVRPDVCGEIKARYPGIRTYPDHAALFRESPTDVVCVATWPPSHKAVTLDAIQLPLAGILVEKPLAETAAAGRGLLDAIRDRKLPVAVPHGLLVAPHVTEIVRRVRGGEIGDLKLVEIQCTGWDIINAGIHWLNFVVVLTAGAPAAWVLAQCDKTTRTYRDGMQVETLGVTYVHTRGGVNVVMTTGDDVPISRDKKGVVFRLVGTRGVLEFWAWESAYLLCSPELPEGRRIEVEVPDGSPHQRHLDRLAGQMDAGRPDYGWAEGSLAALEMVEAAYLSARHGVKVELPIRDFRPPEPNDWDPGRPYGGSGGGRDGRKL